MPGPCFHPLEPRALLAAIAWDGGGGDSLWSNPLNWSTNTVPTLTDDASISLPGPRTIIADAGPIRVKSLTVDEKLVVNAGVTLSVTNLFTLNPNADLRINGLVNWRVGTWASTSPVRLQPGGKLNIGSSANPDVDAVLLQTQLINQARLAWQGGSIQLPASGSILNSPSKRFDIASPLEITPYSGTTGTVTNEGVLRRGGSAGAVTTILVHYTQAQTARTTILSGTLVFGQASSPGALDISSSGTYHVASGAIEFHNDAAHADAVYTGAAGSSFYLWAGLHTLDGSFIAATTSARVSNDALVYIPPASTVTFDGLMIVTRPMSVDGTLNNDGSLFFSGTLAQPAELTGDGLVRLRSGATLSFANAHIEPDLVIQNGATLRFLDAGQGSTATLTGGITAAGTIRLTDTTLSVNTPLLLNQGDIILENSTLDLDVEGDALTNDGTLTLDAASQLNIVGDLAGSGTFNVAISTSDFAAISVTGALSIGPTAELRATFVGDGFVADQSWSVFTYASRSGTFTYSHTGLTAPLTSSLLVQATALNIRVVNA